MKSTRICKSLVCGTLAAVLLFMPVKAATSSEIQEQIDALKTKSDALQEQVDSLEAQISENVDQIEIIVEQKDTIDKQIVLLHDQITNTNEQIAAYGVLIADRQMELEKEEENLAQLQIKHKTRIRAMEEQGTISYWSILFNANSFADFLDRLEMIREIADADNRRLLELRDAAQAVEEVKTKLQTEKEALEIARGDMEKTQQTLSEKRAQADVLLQELISKGNEFEMLLEQSEQKQDALMEELAKKEAEYDDAAYQEWLATSEPSADTGSIGQTQPPASSSGWLTPVPYYTLTSPFGMRFHPILNIWRMHNGVDMACAENTPIYASRSGVVTVADYQENGAGNYVQIDHGDGYRSIYMHMTRYVVRPGEYVTAGQTIGYVGNTGLSKGNHLHFGISYNGEYVNPMEYLP